MRTSFINCESCIESKANETPITKRPPLLLDIAQIRAFNIVERTNVRHAFDLPGIVAQYTVQHCVYCSFPGHHRHMNGFVGVPRCSDVMLCVGHTCAGKSILDWEQLSERLEEFNLQRSRAYMIRAVPELSARFARLSPRIKATPLKFILASDVLVHTSDAAAYQGQCRSAWDPDMMSEEELDAAARIARKFVEAVIAAEVAMAAIEAEMHGEMRRQWEQDTSKVVRKEIRQLFKEMQRRP